MPFKPIQKLNITRTLSTGEGISVGVLAQNRQGVFFQYEESYISRFGNLSPFTLQANTQIQIAPEQPHHGIHGVFDDSLPDGWGRLLQDRIFRQNGILPAQVTAMDRLAMVGDRGMGALSFLPVSEFSSKVCSEFDLATLGLEAETLFDESLYAHKEQDNMDGHTQQVLAALVAGGSSGGGRPKAQVYMQSSDMKHCRTFAQPGDEAWLVKFTSKNLPLGHEEGLCEAVYLQMAEQANCQPPIWQLLKHRKTAVQKLGWRLSVLIICHPIKVPHKNRIWQTIKTPAVYICTAFAVYWMRIFERQVLIILT